MKKKVYIASPFFTDTERALVRRVATQLRKNWEVYVPMEHEIPQAWEKSNAQWAKEVFEADKTAIDNCDMMIVINWGMNVDTGTAWECGYACGSGIPVVEILAKDSEIYSLMMINSADRLGFDTLAFGNNLSVSEVLSRIEQK